MTEWMDEKRDTSPLSADLDLFFDPIAGWVWTTKIDPKTLNSGDTVTIKGSFTID
jgi:hypothetical protein